MIEPPQAHPAWDRFWKYDRLSSFLSSPGAPNYGPAIADGWRAFFSSLPDGARVLDLATGNGAIAVMAVAADKAFTVTGADLAAVEPTAFVSRNRAELAQVRFLANTPAEALPLPDSSFDAVVSQYGVEYSNLTRSIPEAVRILAPGGRLRFAIHAANGAVARDTASAIVDADFLIDLDITGLAARADTALDPFNAGLRAIADRTPSATDQAMLANVHQTLCDTYDHRRSALLTTAQQLHAEITAHRDRQAALLAAACSTAALVELGMKLATRGMTAITLGEQRDGADLIGHIIEARRG